MLVKLSEEISLEITSRSFQRKQLKFCCGFSNFIHVFGKKFKDKFFHKMEDNLQRFEFCNLLLNVLQSVKHFNPAK